MSDEKIRRQSSNDTKIAVETKQINRHNHPQKLSRAALQVHEIEKSRIKWQNNE